MDKKQYIPKSWIRALDNKATITDEDIVMFGKANISHLAFNLQASVTKLNNKRNKRPAASILEFVKKLKELQKVSPPTPLFPEYRNANYLKESELAFLYINSMFVSVECLCKDKLSNDIMIIPKNTKMEYLDRFTSIKSRNILSFPDYEFLKSNRDFAKIWFGVAYSYSPNFNLSELLSALNE